MGRKEEPMIEFYEKRQHFAELMNGWLFGGQEEISPEQVRSMNSRYTAKSGKGYRRRYRSRYRDVIKRIEGSQIHLILGTEIQSYIDYAMPVRIMDYDAVEYSAQISDILQKNRRENPKQVNLSAIEKTDLLTPILTFVLYLGEEPWDAANNLHNILDFSKVPEKLKQYIPDYPFRVLDVCHTLDERLLEFPDDIACMFLILKYQKDKKKLLEVVERFQMFQNVSEDAYDAVWTYTNERKLLEIKDKSQEENGGVNVCQAIRELVEDGKNEGINRVNQLILFLSAENRFDDLEKAARDVEYQRELFRVYGI